MRATRPSLATCCLLVAAVVAARGADHAGGHGSCTGSRLEPRCRGTWSEVRTHEPEYEMRCEYGCARGRDPWHAPAPECRCSPPCGTVYVRKRLYKSEGAEKVERVPKYAVEMAPHRPCLGDGCTGRWDPLGIVWLFHAWCGDR